MRKWEKLQLVWWPRYSC